VLPAKKGLAMSYRFAIISFLGWYEKLLTAISGIISANSLQLLRNLVTFETYFYS
jgi:hypothetical protein